MKKLNIKRRAAETLDLPSEYLLNTTRIILNDFSRLQVLNYKSIIEYGENVIRINTKEKIIKLSGTGLNIDNITDEEIGISGKIDLINFE